MKILPGDKPGKPFKVTTSVDRVARASPKARADLSFVEQDYAAVVAAARQVLGASGRGKVDPRVMWLVADQLQGFLTRLSDIGFYLLRQDDTLGRDLGMSAGSLRKIMSFRRRYPRISMINPAIPWARYRENKV